MIFFCAMFGIFGLLWVFCLWEWMYIKIRRKYGETNIREVLQDDNERHDVS
jgi:hypothetical protein